MEIKLYQIDAFANKPFEGNPAAVCLLEEWLPDNVLQAIALEIIYRRRLFLCLLKMAITFAGLRH